MKKIFLTILIFCSLISKGQIVTMYDSSGYIIFYNPLTNTKFTLTSINTIGSSAGGGGSMVYPGAGIALSTGAAWGTSITDNSANWNTAYGWGNHATAGYLPATITSPSVDQVIRYNGSAWVNGAASTTSAGSGVNYFYSNTASGISTYETISTTPDAGAEQDESTVVNNNTVAFEAYSTTAALGRTSLDAGIWTFQTYTYVSSIVGTTTLSFKVYSRTAGGSETLLFTVTTPDIDQTSVGLMTVSSVQPAYSINSTDLIVIKLDATTDAVTNTTVHFVHSGTTHYSYISTPLITTHNNLAGLQGGTTNEFYHLTSAEYTGTGTGNFVRTSTPTIATPSITTGFTIGGAAASGKFIVGNGTNYVASTSTIPTSAGATANKLLLSDGTNYVLSTPTFPNASATALKWMRSDGTNWIASTGTIAESAVTSGKILTSDATNWTASSYILSGTSAQTYTFPSATATLAQLGANTFTGTQALGANNLTMTGSIAATGARVTKGWFTDIESTNMPTVGGTSLSSTFSPIAGSASIVTIGTITSGGLGTGSVIGKPTMTLGSDADGDMYYRAGGVLTRLPKGTSAQHLIGGTIPAWVDTATGGGGMTNPMTTQGDLIYGGASGTPTRLAAGTANYVLQTNGAGAAPTWVVLAGGGNALTSNPLSQFASTTSSQLAGVMSDEVGTDKLVYNTNPTLVLPSINNVSGAYATTATAAGTTTLTVADKFLQYFTGATTQTVVMPDATTLTAGMQYEIVNNSSGVVTVNKNGGTLIKAMAASTSMILTVTDISSAAGVYTTAYSTDLAIGNATATTLTATTVVATAGAGFQNMVVQTSGSAASWSLPAALQVTGAKFKVTIIGGGGQGGGTSTTAGQTGGGGGSGGVVVYYVTYVAGQNTMTYTVGAGGSTSTGSTTGQTGTASSIIYNSVTITASGGVGGLSGATNGAGGAGGAASGGTLNIAGFNGSSSGTMAATSNFQGDGGNTPLGFGQGGRMPSTAAGANGNPGLGYGAGGSGGRNGTGTTARNGGAGVIGVVIIEY